MTNIYFGVDPGVTTGVGWYVPANAETASFGGAYEHTDPYAIIDWIEDIVVEQMERNWTLKQFYTVEAFNGGGYRTTEAIQTLELVGFFYHTFCGYSNTVVRKVGSNQRMSGMREAVRILGPVQAPPHRWDALSHAVVHSREENAPN